MKTINSTGYRILLDDIISAKGIRIYNKEGKAYLDFESGVWALPLGHNPDVLNKVYCEQTKQLSHIGYLYDSQITEECATRLIDITNVQDGKCVFLSSGSEAVEYAIQIAKKLYPGKKGCRLRRYYLSAYGLGHVFSPEWVEIIDSLENIDFSEVGYFVFEPGNCSGIVKLPQKKLVHEIIEKIKANNGIVIVDEVTTGFGRTGKWFGYMHYDFVPDIIAMGKGLGNGYPVSAVLVRDNLIDSALKAGFGYAQSHQNDPLGAKIAATVIDELKNLELINRSETIGIYFRNQLASLAAKHGTIEEIRGIGLMNAMTFSPDVSEESIKKMQMDLFDAGMLVQVIPFLRIMRFYPPLIIEKTDIDYLVGVLDKLISEHEIREKR